VVCDAELSPQQGIDDGGKNEQLRVKDAGPGSHLEQRNTEPPPHFSHAPLDSMRGSAVGTSTYALPQSSSLNARSMARRRRRAGRRHAHSSAARYARPR